LINKQTIDPDFLIQPYKNGISFIKPELGRNHSLRTIGELLNLPMSVYIYNTDNDFVIANEECAALVAADSPYSMKGNDPPTYCDKTFSDKIISIDNEIIRTESMRVVEESGSRIDDSSIQCMSVKLPVYTNDKVCGLLGFSIATDGDSIKFFAAKIGQLVKTGLLGESGLLNAKKFKTLSKREMEILRYLFKGQTAKMIGEILNISKRTVENNIARIKDKTNCQTRAELFSLYKYLLD
jgi:DNA-binding CsgD family transcriptional regulator